MKEVLRDAHLSPVVGEFVLTNILLKVYVVHNVSTLGAPVANDALSVEFELYCLLELVITVSFSLKISYLFKACSCRHELEDTVYGKRAANLCLEG